MSVYCSPTSPFHEFSFLMRRIYRGVFSFLTDVGSCLPAQERRAASAPTAN